MSGDLNVPAALHQPWLFSAAMDPQGTGPLTRDLSGTVDLVANG